MSITVSSPKGEAIIANAPGELSETLTLESGCSVITNNGEFDNFAALTESLLQVPKSAIDEVHRNH